MAFGDKPFSIKEITVAALNSDGTYGTAVSVPQARKLTVTPNIVTSKLIGTRSKTAAVASVLQDATVEIDGGGYTWDALAVMIGTAVTETGVTPNQTKQQNWAAATNMPYFGLIGVLDDDDGGDMHIGFPKVKLTSLPAIEAAGDEEAFITNVMEGVAIADDDGYVMYPVAHETAEAANFTTIFS